MIDNYALKARYYPIVILLFPVVILGFTYSFEFESLIHLLTSIGVVGAFTYLFSQIGRDLGKRKEPNLWKDWGGAPTTQVLRLKSSFLDAYTKQRYHQKLQALCPVPQIPTNVIESNNPEAADEVYKAWTRYLITQTRDPEKFPLLLKDNTSYGFRRNLWGLKTIALILLSVFITGNYLFWWYQLKTANPLLFPVSFIYSELLLLLLICFWIFWVNKSWVRIPAFSYAERLCECVESM